MHGGRIYEYAEQTGRRPEEIVDFSANINPLGPPTAVVAALEAAMASIVHYPDARHTAVKSALSERFGVDKQAIFCGNGASEVIDLTVRQLKPTRVFVCEPAFAEYEVAAHRAGATVVHLPLAGDFSLPSLLLRGTAAARPARGDAAIFNNPHNPTGHCWQRRELLEVVEALCATGVYVLVDESFMDFRSDEGELTLIPWVRHLKTLVVVRSATKIFAIPGLRFGFGIAHPEAVRRIETHRDPWSVNQLCQAAAVAAYQDDAFLTQTHEWLRKEHAYIGQTWGAHPAVRLYPPSVNYFLLQLLANTDAESVIQGLQEKGMFVRRCDTFRCLDRSYLRIAIKTHADNERLWGLAAGLLNPLL